MSRWKINWGETSLENQLWYGRTLLSTIGLDVTDQNWLRGPWKFIRPLGPLYIFLSLLEVVFIGGPIKILKEDDSRSEQIATLSTILNAMVVYGQVLFFLVKRSDIRETIALAESFVDFINEKDENEARVVKERMKITKKITAYCCLPVLVSIVLFVLFPLLLKERMLPAVPSSYPGLHPVLKSPQYELIYAMDSFMCVASAISFSSFLFFYITFIGFTESQLTLLKYKTLRAIQHSSSEQLSICVKLHSNIIALSNSVRLLYAEQMLFEFIINSISISSALFSNNLSMFMTSVPHRLMSSLMYCIFSEYLIGSGESLEWTIYNSGWDNLSPLLRRQVTIMLMMSQKKLSLTLGGFNDLSLRLFSSMMNMIYSAYALIKHME